MLILQALKLMRRNSCVPGLKKSRENISPGFCVESYFIRATSSTSLGFSGRALKIRGGAPDDVEFRTRLAQDRNLEPDEQGHPHPLVEKARDLFTDFPDLLVYAPNRFRKCLKRAFFKRYGYG